MQFPLPLCTFRLLLLCDALAATFLIFVEMISRNSQNIIERYASYCTVSPSKQVVKYTDTVLLPKTRFQHHLNAKQTVERDSKILAECSFSDLYSWQRKNMRGREFTLLDGPPYANGQVHIGHAINKVLKDVINRAKLLQGHRIHFIPGWDCHGLPIELKATVKANSSDQGPVDIRRSAREFASKTIAEQKAAFQSWGVMANWDGEVYHTYDPAYVIRQLQIFWELFNQGLLYRDLKPVYWSPVSRTALAESELVYKDQHISDAVTLRLRTVNPGFAPPSTPVYLLVWTTTPWTLPVNEAVCYSNEFPYSLVTIDGFDGLYIVGSSSFEQLQSKLKRQVQVVQSLDGNQMAGLQYIHPWRSAEQRPLLHSEHVTSSGTSLVHVAPAHGHDDFLVGLRHGLSKISLVDEDGKYIAGAGDGLAGLSALYEGAKFVLERLRSDIIHQERFTHSYPYDWRTDTPVLIRASQQWFIDTASLKQPALECLDGLEGSTDRLRSLLTSRPYWCISRQRAWGVPIPAFYQRSSGRPLVVKAIVDRLCRHISKGSVDAWWTAPDTDLFPQSACEELCVNLNDVERGSDIMDIWVDSGVAWSGLEGRVADVCLEGGDQHTGWFQSSLLTSVAVQGKAPVRRLLTHGFAVDETGRKMSKSLGNVVDPQAVVKSAGVDALRWWTASHAHHSCVPASERHIQAARESVIRLRGTVRFLLGALRDATAEELATLPNTVLDKYVLHTSKNVFESVMAAYNTHAWNSACTQIVNFASGPVSNLFLHVIKDRLYCDAADSPRRLSCRAAVNGVLDTLTACVAPVLPHLAEEIQRNHPVHEGRFWYRSQAWTPPSSWNCPEASDVLAKALAIKAQIDQMAAATATAPLSCQLALHNADASALSIMQREEESWDSELTELFQVASVCKTVEEKINVELKETTRTKCPRCRRFTAAAPNPLCERCVVVLNG